MKNIKRILIVFGIVFAAEFLLCFIDYTRCLFLDDANNVILNAKHFGWPAAIKEAYFNFYDPGSDQKLVGIGPTGDELDHLKVMTYEHQARSLDLCGYEYVYFSAYIWQRIGENYVNVGSVHGWFSNGRANTDQLIYRAGKHEAGIIGPLPKSKVVDYQTMSVQRFNANGDPVETNSFITIKPPLLVSKLLSDRYTQQALTNQTARSGEIVSYVVSEQQPTVPLASK